MSPWRLREISRQINRGAIIAYPTDTIWGLGCNPLSKQAIMRLQHLKRRSANKGLILLSSRLDYLQPYIDPDEYNKYHHHLSVISVEPLTWIVKASRVCPDWLTGNRDTLAIRLTRVKLVNQLCELMHSPLVSTSANISGRSPIRNSLLAHKHFQQSVDFIVEGFKTRSTQASRIKDLKTGKILRA